MAISFMLEENEIRIRGKLEEKENIISFIF